MNDPRQVRLDDAIQAMDDLITPEVMLSVVAEIRRLRSLLNPPCAEANCKRKPQVQAGSQWLCNDHFMARLHASLVGGPDAAAT